MATVAGIRRWESSNEHRAQQIHREVGHPIIDADGHVLEVLEATHPHLREALGATLFDEWLDRARSRGSRNVRARPRSAGARARRKGRGGAARPSTRATGRRRRCRRCCTSGMDEIGIDFSVLYPTNTLLTCAEEDAELRRGLCAGFNSFFAEIYGPFADRR